MLKKSPFFVIIILFFFTLKCESQSLNYSDIFLRWESSFYTTKNSLALKVGFPAIMQDFFNLPLLFSNIRGITYLRQGNKQAALENLYDSIKINPDYYNSYYIRANINIDDKNFINALKDYNKIIQIFPKSYYSYYNRGLLYLALDDTLSAEKNFYTSIELFPEFASGYEKIGAIKAYRNEYKTAVTFFSKSIDLGLSTEKNYLRRGKAYLKLKKYNLALNDLNTAFSLNESKNDIRLYRAIAYKMTGSYKEALADLEACTDHFTTLPLYHMLKSELFYYLGNRNEAARLFNNASAKFPEFVDNCIEKGHDYFSSEFMKRYFFTQKNPCEIILIGDSMAGGGLRFTLANFLSIFSLARFSHSYKVSSGLANIRFYDWQTVLSGLLKEKKYDLAIVMMGTNDGQGLVENGQGFRFGSAGWLSVYRNRVDRFIKTLSDNFTETYWIGMPPMNDPAFHLKMKVLNTVFKEVCSIYENVEYVSAFKILGGDSESFQKYVTIDGVLKLARYGDDIHFRMAGIKPLGYALLEMILNDFNIPEE